MSATPNDPLLEVSDVTVRFGGLIALNKVRLSVEPGSVVGLIGPNGAGKTTLFNVLSGIVAAQEGEVRWAGQRLRRHRPHHLAGLGIARTLQGLQLFAGMTCLDNVMVGADRHSRSGLVGQLTGLGRQRSDDRQLMKRAMAALEEVDAADVAWAYPTTLPYGLQKRIALARALVGEPRLLLLDEPASGLSQQELAELGERIRHLRGRMAVVLVEHHMDLVMSVCDRIAVLNFGELISTGTPDEVQQDPKVTEAYLGEPAGVAND